MSARMVKPFAGGNKNDAADARAIWTAVQQPDTKGVVVKSEGQQAVLALHRMREQLVKFRAAQINALRGPGYGVRRGDASVSTSTFSVVYFSINVIKECGLPLLMSNQSL
jgi:transposase